MKSRRDRRLFNNAPHEIEPGKAGAIIAIGSCASWDLRLDGRLAGALMSIPAVKGVEVGGGIRYIRAALAVLVLLLLVVGLGSLFESRGFRIGVGLAGGVALGLMAAAMLAGVLARAGSPRSSAIRSVARRADRSTIGSPVPGCVLAPAKYRFR